MDFPFFPALGITPPGQEQGGPILNGDDDGASDGPAHSWISPSFLLLGLHRQAKSRGPQVSEGAQGLIVRPLG